ncbi:MAG: 50S ribosomal protein L22 [Candidatus Odinarchaeia archaeon]
MPKFKYSVIGLDPDSTAIASAREVHVSPKHAREVCNAIRNMRLDKAKEYLENVIQLKALVPFRRYKKKQAHHGGIHKFYAGRYPVKAAREVLKVLENAENNAEYKGLDLDNLVIIHSAAYGGRKIRKYIPRAFGRSTPYFETLTHIEIAVAETESLKGE